MIRGIPLYLSCTFLHDMVILAFTDHCYVQVLSQSMTISQTSQEVRDICGTDETDYCDGPTPAGVARVLLKECDISGFKDRLETYVH